MGPRCSFAETQVCHRSYIIAATKTGRHDIAEIFLKVTLNTIYKKKIQLPLFTCESECWTFKLLIVILEERSQSLID